MCQNTTSHKGHKTYTLIQWAFNCIWPIDDRASTKTRVIWFSKSTHEIYIRTHSSNILECIHQPDLGTPLYGGQSSVMAWLD